VAAGIHLIKHTAFRTLERGGQFVLLGSAPDPRVQAEFNTLNSQMRSENAAFCFSYDEPLSHLIYAGCDLIVVPSMFEPCGLTQVCHHLHMCSPVVAGVHVGPCGCSRHCRLIMDLSGLKSVCLHRYFCSPLVWGPCGFHIGAVIILPSILGPRCLMQV
jgi:hypothetical protein